MIHPHVEQMQQAADCFARGEFEAAEELFQQLTTARPHDPSSFNNLGTVLLAMNRLEDARHCFHRSLELEPEHPSARNNLALCCAREENYREAVRQYRQVLKSAPDFAEAWNNLGTALRELKQTMEAVTCFQRALELQPGYRDAAVNLASSIALEPAMAEANATLRGLAEQFRDDTELLNYVAGCQKRIGDKPSAVATYQRTLELHPDSLIARNNLGNLLLEMHRPSEAASHFAYGLQSHPTSAALHFNLGNAHFDVDELRSAEACFRQALAIEPDYTPAQRNLASTLKRQGDFCGAEEWYRRASHGGRSAGLLDLQLAALVPPVYLSADDMVRTVENLKRALRQCDVADGSIALQDVMSVASEAPHHLQFLAGNVREIKELYGRAFQRWLAQPRLPSARTRSNASPLRLGCVVTAGHEDIFLKSLAGLLCRVDANRLQVVVLCGGVAMARVKAAFDGTHVQVRTLPTSLPEAVETMARGNFDVAYYWEVGSDALNYFLPFYGTAPVQCTSWGTQTTSGIPNLRYYLSSELVEPPNAAESYSEQLLLSTTLLTYQTPVRCSQRVSRAQFGFDGSSHLYLCAQHLGKIHVDFDDWLGEILLQDERGLVVLIEDAYGHAARTLKQRFAKSISQVADRVIFLPRMHREKYLNLMAVADVLLDAPYFAGVNTTYDAFSLAKPIVTCPSSQHRGRHTLGCYRKMGMDELISVDREAYVHTALRCGCDPDWRHFLESRILERNSVLFHDSEAIDEFERLVESVSEQGK